MGMGRSITISDFTPIVGRRSRSSSGCRRRRWSGAKSSSSCARLKPACGSTSPSWGRFRSASTPRTTSKLPAPSSAGVDLTVLLHTRPRMIAPATRPKIVFQGEPGANYHIACREAYPDGEHYPPPEFEDALNSVASGEAELGMIPIENSVAGRVADIHHLMPSADLHIVAEYFLPVRHQLMAPKGAQLSAIKSVESHVMALGQCRNIIRRLGLKPIVAADTAGSAREVAERGDKSRAAIASRLAAEIYGLDILAEDVEDE